jgi:prepilin peptidase CpaA
MSFLAALLAAVFPALVITGALKDATSYRIPNWIPLALAAGFLPAAFALGMPLPAIGLCAAVGAGALVLGMAMFAFRWIGGGDAKLFAAAALWLGWPASGPYLIATCLAGGALAVGLLGLRSAWVRPLVVTGPRWFTRLAEPDEAVPYGLAIAVGALAGFAGSPFAAAFHGLL